MSQKSVVLAMLREAGPRGVSVHELVYRKGITRAAAIVFELRDEGFDIETQEAKDLPDGRKRLAHYVLRNARRTLPPKPTATMFDEIAFPAPAQPLKFACGCVRSADGRSWEERCPEHTGVVKAETIGW